VSFEEVSEQAEEGVRSDAVVARWRKGRISSSGPLRVRKDLLGVGELRVGADDVGSSERGRDVDVA
jgi:hypothetical protein